MTTPNLGPGDVPDYTDAANSGNLSDQQGADPSAVLQGQVAGLTGPVGAVGSLIMGALGGIVGDVQGFQQPGKRKKSLQGASAFAQFEAGGASPSVPRPLQSVINGIVDGWFGGGGVGDPLQVQYTIQAIKDAVINGYNVETKVTSGTWTKPENLTELVVVAIGCGQNGQNGNGGTSRALGGLGGGFIAQSIDPESVAPTTSYVVGLNQAPSSFGAHLSTIPGSGGISTTFGYTETSSLPGRGGDGGRGSINQGDQTSEPGMAGEGTPLASGGAGGARGVSGSNAGQPGSAGGNANAAAVTKAGGGGGGGGGGGLHGFANWDGGAGGPGGYPGGGGGGGGGRSTGAVGGSSNGAGGLGAAGIIWIFWR